MTYLRAKQNMCIGVVCLMSGAIVMLGTIVMLPLEAVTDGCSLPKTQRNQALVLLVISGPISKCTSFSRMLLLGPFRTTHSYFDNSVSICPTSVSYYKWTLSKHPSVHAKRKVTIFSCCWDISHPVFLRGPERTV